VRTAKQWVDEGRIGDIIRVQREFLTSPATDRMLVGHKHWSHRLPGGRWFETLPHELYLTHWFAGAMTPIDAAIASTPAAPPGAPADEVVLTLGGPRALATIHFSANCAANRRVFTLQGSLGQIQVDILSDLATVQTIKDARWSRAAGRPLLAAGQALLQGVGDRSRYGWRRLRGESPHVRAVKAFADYVLDRAESPTPLDEIEYVVVNCDRIGGMIDARLREIGKVPSAERIEAHA
jgi:predicted dehydrogenase